MSASLPSIARRLTNMTLLASGAALLMASVAFGWYDRVTFRGSLTRRLAAQAEIVAANSASALVFNDPTAAEATLRALSAAPSVVGAVISLPAGTPFAVYRRDGESGTPAPVATDGPARFEGDRLRLSREIRFDGRRLGDVTIESDLHELAQRQQDYYKMSALILVASLGAALLLSWSSQRAISRPIVDLATIASDVSRDQDYSRRAAVAGGAREIATLVDTFNEMLAHIQERDRSLHRAHDQLEERVRLRTAELDAANRELEAFSYSVSHDLRAPLRHVTGFGELLEEHAGAGLDDQGRRYIHTMTTAARRMARLIDDLLAFSKISRTAIARRRVSLDALVVDARHEVAPEAAAPNRQIEWHVAPLPDVDGDPALLRLVLVNLLSNAVKYSAPRAVARIEIGTIAGDPGDVVLFVRRPINR